MILHAPLKFWVPYVQWFKQSQIVAWCQLKGMRLFCHWWVGAFEPQKNESQARSSSAASPKRTIWIVHNILEITRIVETTNQLVVHETKAPELHLQLSNCTSNLTSGGWGTCPACLVLVIKPKYPKSNQKADLERDPPLLHLSIPASSCHSHIPQGQQKPLCPATIAGIWFGSWWWSFLADISGATPALT